MMTILLTFLTVVLVVNCLLLMLLVLIQLPKKEAGAGLAFGAGTADAVLGAGSGNALTKLTKYSAITFLLLSSTLGILNARNYHAGESDVRRALQTQKASTAAPAPAAPAKPASEFQSLTPATNFLSTPVAAPATNVAAPATTNKAATNK